jgi:hypothetical protein
VQQEMEQHPMQAEVGLDRFLEDPSAHFGHSLTRMMGNSRADIDSLQLAGLKRRFTQFRGRLPMLDKLAERQRIHSINQLDDVVPLLFGHEIYKSYPASLLEKHRFTELTRWLSKLTTLDLSKTDVSACHCIDDWLITMRHDVIPALDQSGVATMHHAIHGTLVSDLRATGAEASVPNEHRLHLSILPQWWPVPYCAQRCRGRRHCRQ